MTQLNYINKPLFEHGAIDQISTVLRSLDISNPLICSDKGIVALGMIDKLRNLLSNHLLITNGKSFDCFKKPLYSYYIFKRFEFTIP